VEEVGLPMGPLLGHSVLQVRQVEAMDKEDQVLAPQQLQHLQTQDLEEAEEVKALTVDPADLELLSSGILSLRRLV